MKFRTLAQPGITAFIGPLLQQNLKALAGICLVVALSACNSADFEPDADEGGIIGTGITLEGTASSTQNLASQRVQIKSISGTKSTTVLDAEQRFATANAGESGPWLLRVSTGHNQYLYGLSYGDNTSNINSYSDLILRNWFARAGHDINRSFDSMDQIVALPSPAEFQSIESAVFNIVQLVLDSYRVNGDDVIRGDLMSDDGVALFLARNPVVTSKNNVTFLVTDPTTETQSSLASQLQLNRNFTLQETTPPAVPSGVRVLGSGPNEMVVVWSSSSDDSAVVSYEVFRDGVSVAVTPYPVYVDVDVYPEQNYNYSIVASDVWGNRSSESEVRRGATLTEIDTVPPQQPSKLLAPIVTSNRIELIWGHSDVSDVVKFVLYRGTDSSNLQVVSQLTSNYATDINVADNNRYCYQVSAQDASANLSARSEVLCVETPSADGQSADLGGNNLIIPDVNTLACDTVLSNADVEDGAYLAAGCYQVNTDLILTAGKNLSLSAGTVLKFSNNVGLYIDDNASISSLGSTQNPVVLTGTEQVPGHWNGLTIDRSSNRANLIRNTVIEYAGGSEQRGAIRVISTTGELTRFRLENSLLQWSSGFGLEMANNGTVVELFSGNVLANNRRPAVIGVQYLESVAGNNSFSGNSEDLISIGRNTFDYSINIPDVGVPLRSNGFNMKSAPLNIEPGVEFLFYSDTNTEVSIDSDSRISAKGTAEKPIVMRAQSSVSGSWGGISIASKADNVLDYVVIENAGGTTAAYTSALDNGAIRLNCEAPSSAKLTLTNSQVLQSSSWGLYQNASGCTLSVADSVVFGDNALGDIKQP